MALAVLKSSPFSWSERKERAALRLAEDELSDELIASEAGVTRRALTKWKDHPEFRARIQSNLAEIHAAMMRKPIAKRAYRIKRLNDLEEKSWQVIEARAGQYAHIPGGDSGLLVGQLKQVKHVKDSYDNDDGPRVWTEEHWEYAVDTGVMREIRSIYDQAATETGQKVERVESAVMMAVQLVGVSPDDI